jgi:hypothetical protein
MALVLDHGQSSSVGAHALVVGISAYPNLGSATDPLANAGIPLPRISTSAISALAFRKWLDTAKLPVPLVSVRLLVSPSPEEISRDQTLESLRTPCTSDVFIDESSRWRSDLAFNTGNVAIFFFSGHGLMRAPTESLLLFEDFGSSRGRMLQGAVELNSIIYGLVPGTPMLSSIARRQYFFIDTPRIYINSPEFAPLRATPVFDANLSTIDDREMAVFYAAAPGGMAFEERNGYTIFTNTLLRGLTGAAADTPSLTGDDHNNEWFVTVNSLAGYLAREGTRLSSEHKIDISFGVSGTARDAILTRVDVPQKIPLYVHVGARLNTREHVELRNQHGELVERINGPRDSPITFEVNAGLYLLQRRDRRRQQRGMIISVLPPRTEIDFAEAQS